MKSAGCILILALAALQCSGSNIRGELSSSSFPSSHARITVENFAHQRLNPSSLNFNLFTDERGEETAVYAWRAGHDTKNRDTLRLTNFDSEVMKFVRGKSDVDDVVRRNHVKERKRILEMTPAALDTSADDQGTNEGVIGKFADRSIENVKAAAKQEAPYVEEDSRGIILAKSMTIHNQLHVKGGRYLIMDSSDIVIQNIHQWKLIVDETYDDSSSIVQGWVAYSKHSDPPNNKRGRCGVNITPRTDWFLGPYNSVEVTKKFVLPSDHTRLKLSANFHFIDGWNDETAYLKINDKMVWQQGHTMCGSLSVLPELPNICSSKGINSCGNDGVDRMGVLIKYQMEYFSNEIDITFGASLEKDNDASWGVDDLQIAVL